jgi:hypothetical protein
VASIFLCGNLDLSKPFGHLMMYIFGAIAQLRELIKLSLALWRAFLARPTWKVCSRSRAELWSFFRSVFLRSPAYRALRSLPRVTT